ncbi:hypothetical protein BZARG_2019 [Bizionia argentinensis JUB59]|uniref:Uncharacterized protein n=1 Tax=Bizionia argentinensis JUB59 TaxID=1046627 RepID=G2EF85_9FLAO|nr:hypothetical protein [Bizionia argentinensis]EGV42867.2 hypothetical protein BZARG_2019 [Bizionia argentinensis JUB59]
MEDLIIKFNKKRLYLYLFLGAGLAGLATFSIWEDDHVRLMRIGYILIGLLYIGIAFWNYKYHYLTLTEDSIKENFLFGKKLLLKDITHFKKFADEYTFKTIDKNLVIKTALVHKDSLASLESYFSNIDIPEENSI